MAKTKEITIERPDIQRMTVTLVGTTPLIASRVSDEAKGDIEGSAPGQKTGKPKQQAKMTPEQKYLASRYMIDTKTHGFPAAAIKKAMISAVRMLGVSGSTNLSMVAAKPMFSTYPAEGHHSLMKLTFSKVEHHDDWARIPKTGTWVPAHRAVYYGWSCKVVIQFDAGLISPETVLNLVAVAGQVGLGAKRPECNGNNGIFEVAETKATRTRKTKAA
jgi:hypothetical protein